MACLGKPNDDHGTPTCVAPCAHFEPTWCPSKVKTGLLLIQHEEPLRLADGDQRDELLKHGAGVGRWLGRRCTLGGPGRPTRLECGQGLSPLRTRHGLGERPSDADLPLELGLLC